MRIGIISIISPKEPISSAWVRRGECLDTGYAHCAWYHPHYKLSAISAVEVHNKDIGPEYHLSVSKSGKRCSAAEAAFVLKQFGMTGAIEDNHSSARYRRAAGIPLDAPVIGNGRGGNYQITADKAKAIWTDIKRLERAYPAKTVSICQLVADEHGVSKTLVQNIRHGRSWNSVTGLTKKQYD